MLESQSTRTTTALIVESQAMRRVMRDALAYARSPRPVLITGETGTGKEVVARAIHDVSRPGKPFVVIDCGELAQGVLETELFGYTRGAFTGAVGYRSGLFRYAQDGTVLLDEIDTLPRHLQSRLLRVIQERTVRPLGSNDRLRIGAKILAAANCDLRKRVERGSFRADLYYRLGVFSITVPPLRERKEAIPALVAHFARVAADELGIDRPELTPEAERCLIEYKWPGNVRQLENVVCWAVAVAANGQTSHVIDCQSLPPELADPTSHALTTDEAVEELTLLLSEVERRTILRAMRKARGDKSCAARLLGIGKTTLYRKLREVNA